MKEYKVEFEVLTQEEIEGFVNNNGTDSELTEANSPDEAIENIMYYIQEQIQSNNNDRTAQIKDGAVVVTDDETGAEIEEYRYFEIAEEVE